MKREQRNISIFRVKTIWAQDEWYLLSKKGEHLQEFPSGLFEIFFPESDKDKEQEFLIIIRSTNQENANLMLEWHPEKLRWNLFDPRSQQLIKAIYHCDKIPSVFPLAVKDRPNYYRFRCKHVQEGQPLFQSGK